MHYLIHTPTITWEAKEVFVEINQLPHLLARININGAYFPHRGAEPFIKINVSSKKTISSWFTNVSPDNRVLYGYFPINLPHQGILEFGYGSEILARLPLRFHSDATVRLDPNQYPKNTVIVTNHSIEKLQAKLQKHVKLNNTV